MIVPMITGHEPKIYVCIKIPPHHIKIKIKLENTYEIIRNLYGIYFIYKHVAMVDDELELVDDDRYVGAIYHLDIDEYFICRDAYERNQKIETILR
jgi:hypothetical protein